MRSIILLQRVRGGADTASVRVGGLVVSPSCHAISQIFSLLQGMGLA